MVTSSRGETRATVVYTNYTTMVRRAGGLPVILTPGQPEEAAAVLGRLDGLVLTGGGDVDPLQYGGKTVETVYEVDPLRDEYEMALSRAARRSRLPTLAICRGMQVLNVALGGTLIVDISNALPEAIRHLVDGPASIEPQHRVDVEPTSAMAAALGTPTVEVNTIHHQALDGVAEGIRVVGRAPDGVIEAIEPDDATWCMLGVQWHPEYLGPDDLPSMRLFRSLVEAASR